MESAPASKCLFPTEDQHHPREELHLVDKQVIFLELRIVSHQIACHEAESCLILVEQLNGLMGL